MKEGHLPQAPTYEDVTSVGKELDDLKGRVDCVTAGFPCQVPWSCAHEVLTHRCVLQL